MTAIYIGLNYLLLEVFNWKKLDKYSSISTSFFNLLLVLTVGFTSLNFYNLQLLEINKLFVLIPLFIILLIINIFEYRFEKNYIYIKRMSLYSIMVIAINLELVYIAFITFCILYEVYNRAIKSEFVIKTQLIYLIPVIITLPLLHSVELLSNYYKYFILIVFLFIAVIEFDKFNVYRGLSLLMMSCLLINLNGSMVIPLLAGCMLIIITFLHQLYLHQVIVKKQMGNKYLDRFIGRIYVFFEQKESAIQVVVENIPQNISNKLSIFPLKHHNDVVTSFIFIMVFVSSLGLYVIFRN